MYKQSSAGYKGRLHADGPSMQKFPRRIRQIAYDGQEVVDCDAEMAYFAFASQAFGKLRIQIPSTYFRTNTTNAYIADKRCARKSLQGNSFLSYSQSKGVFSEVSNGAEIGPQLRTDRFIRGIDREEREIRWLPTYRLPELYARLVGARANHRPKEVRIHTSWPV